MRAITICQPHAWAVIHGDKPYENRTWTGNYRGLLLIHASKSKKRLLSQPIYQGEPSRRDLVFGAIIGCVEMIDSLSLEQLARKGISHPTIFGPICHVYARPRVFPEPIPCVGALGLWTPRRDILPAINAQLNAIR